MTHTHTHTRIKQRSEREKEMVQWGQNKDKRWSGGREREMPFAGYDWHWLACPNVFGKFAFPCSNFGFQSTPLRPQIHIEKLINLVLVVTWNTNTPDPPLPPSQLLSAFCACVCVFFVLFCFGSNSRHRLRMVPHSWDWGGSFSFACIKFKQYIYIYIAKIDSGSQFESFVNCHAVLFKHLFQCFSNNYIFLS